MNNDNNNGNFINSDINTFEDVSQMITLIIKELSNIYQTTFTKQF